MASHKYSYPTFFTTITHQNGTFLTKGEPTLTLHNHPKSTVYFSFTLGVAHSIEMDRMYNDTYPLL